MLFWKWLQSWPVKKVLPISMEKIQNNDAVVFNAVAETTA